ncbi:arylsulfatase [Algoriphagus namhaensis]|uniref:Arylsulfatase n=1 Tax=Algoriphagus namhaensis TaxID=915353 RepID=A0ABV8AMM2_9BACT
MCLVCSLLFVCLVVFSSCQNKAADNPVKPNIIVILADDLGYGDMGAYNPQSLIMTPYLDQLAVEGMKFTDAHTTSAVCTPTRYSLLTGRYNWRTRLKEGVLTGKSKALIPADRTTLGSMLQRSGYTTAFIGKWHLGMDWGLKEGEAFEEGGWNPEDYDQLDFSKPIENAPGTRGFDYSLALPASLDIAPYVYVENNQITSIPTKVTIDEGEYSWWREGPTSDDFIHEEVTPLFFKKSINYIQEQAKSNTPFFLYLALPSPHTPILPTEAWQGKSGLLPYADFIMMIDDYIGQLNQTLKDAGIEENTLLVFTSDNGCSPAAGFDKMVEMGHQPSGIFRGHKADIYEGGHRVPMIVKWPSKIKPTTVSNVTISQTDLMATFADLVGDTLGENEGEDSSSFLKILFGEQENEDLREGKVFHSVNGTFAIRKGDWKLITAKGSGGWSFPKPGDLAEAELPEMQLYNLRIDPSETQNQFLQNPEKAEELKQLLIKYIQEGRSTPGPKQLNDPFDGEWKQTWFMDED